MHSDNGPLSGTAQLCDVTSRRIR